MDPQVLSGPWSPDQSQILGSTEYNVSYKSDLCLACWVMNIILSTRTEYIITTIKVGELQ